MMITFTNKKKIAYKYSDTGGTLEKLNNLKPLFSRNEELNISKEVKENAFASEGKSSRPETIMAENQYACHDLWNKRQKSNFLSQKVFLQSIIYSSEKKIIGTSSILAWGKSRVLPTDPLFILKIRVLFLYS